jgi:hypothetical protein
VLAEEQTKRYGRIDMPALKAQHTGRMREVVIYEGTLRKMLG